MGKAPHKVFLLLLVTFVALPYLNTLSYPFHFDDRTNIVENKQLHVTGLTSKQLSTFFRNQPSSAINRPFANISFALNYYVGGLEPGSYRLVNIFLHLVNVVLVFFLFSHVMMYLTDRNNLSQHHVFVLSLLAAGLWGASPLHTESVMYIVQRETSMQAPLTFAACVMFLGLFIRDDRKSGWRFDPKGKAFRVVLAGLFFLLSAGVKETAFLFPFALFILTWILAIPSSGEDRKRLLSVLVVMGLITLCIGAFLFLGSASFSWHSNTGVGYGPLQRMLTQPTVLLWYLSLLLFPLPSRLNIDIDFPVSLGFFSPPMTMISIAFWVVTVLVAVRVRRSNPIFSLAVLWFLTLSSLESSFLNLEMAFLHRTYIPSIFIFLLLPVLGYRVLTSVPITRIFTEKQSYLYGLGAWLIVFLVFLSMTYARNAVYRSAVSLWSDAAAKSPGKARPHYNLGAALQSSGRLDEAVEEYKKSLRLDPDYYLPHVNLAVIYEEKGQLGRAVSHLEKAYVMRPEHGEVLYNLGRYRYNAGFHQEALSLFEKALETDHLVNRGDAFWYMALIAEDSGSVENALDHWKDALDSYGVDSHRGALVKERLKALLTGGYQGRPSPEQ